MGQFMPQYSNGVFSFVNVSTRAYFGGRMLGAEDRLGSRGTYYPYGDPRPQNPTDGSVGLATYTFDAATGLNYADQRYQAATYGRFLSPDPYRAAIGSANSPVDPTSWNKYAYVSNDPVNRIDPLGTCYTTPTPEHEGEDCAGYWGSDPEPQQPKSDSDRPSGGGASSFPKCNSNGSPSTTTDINFIINNYQAAAAVAAEADQDFQGLNAQNFNAAEVLGWAAAESGYAPPGQNPDSALKFGNLDYFNMTAGVNWINQVTCPPNANHYWACFGGFQGAAEAALFSPTKYSFQGVPNASAGFVLGQLLGSGASLAQAFQAIKTNLYYGTNPVYGTAAQGAISFVTNLLDCLKQNYAIYF